MVDLAELTRQMYVTITTAAAGWGAQGATPAQVVHASTLRPVALPARPFLALRPGPAPLVERGTYQATYTWLIYDDEGHGYIRINTLAGLLVAAYAAATIQYTTGGVVGLVEVIGYGDETRDEALGLSVRAVRLAALISDA